MKRLPLLLPLALLVGGSAQAGGGYLFGQRLDSVTSGGPATVNGDQFGFALAPLGDLGGDGTQEVAIGAPYDGVPGSHNGSVHIVSLSQSGQSVGNVKIEGVAPVSTDHAQFGRSLANVGDLNGDGIPDLAVGEFFDFWVLFLDKDGAVIDSYENKGLDLGLGSFQFSYSLAPAGDLNGDGFGDLIAGDPFWSEPGNNNLIGGLFVLFLSETGKVIDKAQITEGVGVSGLLLNPGDNFGWSVANVGDIDQDGLDEIAVGAPGRDDGGVDTGAVYILYLNAGGSVDSLLKIGNNVGGLDQSLPAGTRFGTSLAGLGNFDSAAGPDLVVGSAVQGELWKLFLRTTGVVRTSLHYTESELPASYSPSDGFAASLALLGDANGDGVDEIVVGAPTHPGGGTERGAIFTLFPEGVEGAQVSNFGCGINPSGSLFTNGLPVIGEQVEFSLDNPFFGSMNGGASTYLLADVSSFGCGVLLPGTHLDESAPAGELYLIPPFDLATFAGFYEGPGGNLATTTVPIPFTPAFLGIDVYFQGLLFDPSGGPSGQNFYGFTEGKVLTIGT